MGPFIASRFRFLCEAGSGGVPPPETPKKISLVRVPVGTRSRHIPSAHGMCRAHVPRGCAERSSRYSPSVHGMNRGHVPSACTERPSGSVIGNTHRGQGLPDSRPRWVFPIKQGFPLWLDAFGGALWQRFGWTPTRHQKRGPHRRALRTTTPSETPVLPLIFASLQLGGNLASEKVVVCSTRRCGGLCPHLKKSFAGALLRRWGLHFSGGSPESIRAGRTSPGQPPRAAAPTSCACLLARSVWRRDATP